jgi:D-tyrosyl-tRNA(Tyr) deacylase
VALIGIGVEDTADEITPLTQKILSTKLWNEGLTASHIQVPPQYNGDTGVTSVKAETGTSVVATSESDGSEVKARAEQVWGGKPWKTNVMDLQGEILCISQFTLHARLSKGTKPDFHKSMVSVEQ